MTIQPEVLPPNSKEGDDAIQTFPKWSSILIIFLFIMGTVFLLKTIFSSILICMGLYFIWTQATKKID